MSKKMSEKERDMSAESVAAEGQEAASQNTGTDTMADDTASQSDNVSAEPSLEEQIAVWRDKYLRLQAEFDNFRKRTLKEKMELVERGCEGAWKAILPILDDMERAVVASHKSDDIEA
jgi:molecular chaperone GrpE